MSCFSLMDKPCRACLSYKRNSFLTEKKVLSKKLEIYVKVISRKRKPKMNTKPHDDKQKILRILLVFLELTPTQIAKALHVSNSVISKHLSGKKFIILVIFI